MNSYITPLLQQVLDLIEAAGPEGISGHDLAEACRCSLNTLAKRRDVLRRLGAQMHCSRFLLTSCRRRYFATSEWKLAAESKARREGGERAKQANPKRKKCILAGAINSRSALEVCWRTV